MAVIGLLFQLQFIVALIFMPLSVVAIRAARKATPDTSRSQAVIGWLIGFFVIDVVILASVGVYLLVR